MSFINNLVNEFTHQGQSHGNSGGGGGNGPPQCPPPWRAHWDGERNTWIFINEQTGQRQYEFPQAGGYGGGYGQQGGYGGPPQQTRAEHQSGGGGWGKAAIGAAAGVAGGLFLAHEGHEIKEDWDEDKYRAEERVDEAGNYVERKWDNGVQDVEDFPENAARWAGRTTQEVEDIPEDAGRAWDRTEDRVEGAWDRGEDRVEGGFDRFAQGVSDIPEDIAGGFGRVEGNFDRFGDNMENAYDQGEAQGRANDGW